MTRQARVPAVVHPRGVTILIRTEQDVAEAQRSARRLAQAVGFGEVAGYMVATAVCELASNLYFHAHGTRRILVDVLRRDNTMGIEVIAEDGGPGISDARSALQDGFRTNGGLGGSLPGVQRLMDEFHIASRPGKGTRIVARKWNT